MPMFIDNRVWCLNADLHPTAFGADIEAELPSAEPAWIWGCKFAWDTNPLDIYTKERSQLVIAAGAEWLAEMRAALRETTPVFALRNFFLKLNPLGFLQLVATYDIQGSPSITALEEEGMEKTCGLLDSQYGKIEALLAALEAIGVLTRSATLHFGAPHDLDHAVHGPLDSYLYNQHVVFSNDPQGLAKACADLGAPDTPLRYDGAAAYPTWSITLWDLAQPVPDRDFVNLLAADAFALSESVHYDNTTACYNAYLRKIANHERVRANALRAMFNFNTWMLQRLKLFKRNFTTEQTLFVNRYQADANFSGKYELLKDAEQSLKFAIEGIESERAQRSNNIIQFILAFFTALTIYSVAGDLLSLFTEGDPDRAKLLAFTIPKAIFFGATALIALFLWLYTWLVRRS